MVDTYRQGVSGGCDILDEFSGFATLKCQDDRNESILRVVPDFLGVYRGTLRIQLIAALFQTGDLI